MNTLRRSLRKKIRQSGSSLARSAVRRHLSLPFVAIGPAAGRSAAKSGGSPDSQPQRPEPQRTPPGRPSR